MKMKMFLISLFTISLTSVYGQESGTSLRSAYSKADSTVISGNLFLVGKIWGFMKYYHPVIGSGKYNWDKELVDFLPNYVSVKSVEERSDTLESWIKRFGEVSVCDSCSDNILIDAKLTPDFSWINTNNFSASLVATLKNILKSRIQPGQYYTKFRSQDGLISFFFNTSRVIVI